MKTIGMRHIDAIALGRIAAQRDNMTNTRFPIAVGNINNFAL